MRAPKARRKRRCLCDNRDAGKWEMLPESFAGPSQEATTYRQKDPPSQGQYFSGRGVARRAQGRRLRKAEGLKGTPRACLGQTKSQISCDHKNLIPGHCCPERKPVSVSHFRQCMEPPATLHCRNERKNGSRAA
ncbi:hypothetical protein Y1Q_0016548 [Alligator mississippiensis]|uniref:Uncharacterized protein n=1 Tax=Alligator mississippiensis TaxID=8496 RepID=A0A151N329_ALLMI|nr:hypothetical protein Y1Q_0016548 [Alligator mississippiensis]